MVRWFRRLITVGLALVLALLIGPLASRASLMDLMPQLEGQGSVEEQLNQTLEGKFELAKSAHFWSAGDQCRQPASSR